jgi:hypothetical protein
VRQNKTAIAKQGCGNLNYYFYFIQKSLPFNTIKLPTTTTTVVRRTITQVTTLHNKQENPILALLNN